MIPIPIGQTWTVTLSQAVGAHFECSACRWTSPVVVKAVTQGEGLSPLFLDDDGAQEWAEKKARQAVAGTVSHYLGLVPCPQCGAPGPLTRDVAKNERLQAALFGGVLALGVFFVGMMAAAAPELGVRDSTLWAIAALASSAVAAAVGFAAYSKIALGRRIRAAKRAVVFGAQLERDELELFDATPPAEPELERIAAIPEPSTGASEQRCPACGASSWGTEFCSSCLGALPPHPSGTQPRV